MNSMNQISVAPENCNQSLRHFTMMRPTTLSKAFENSSMMNSGSRAGKSVVSCPEKVVDLNVPLPAEAEMFSPPASTRYQINQGTETSSGGKQRVILTLDEAIEHEMKLGRGVDTNMDPKKLRRTVSNRLSAQRSRLKKAQYITELEEKIKDLQETISFLTPQIESVKHKQNMLRIQKTFLEQQLNGHISKSNSSNRQIEDKKREVRRLKELQMMRRGQMIYAPSSRREQLTSFGMYSNLNNYEEARMNTDQALVDQYLDLEAMNLHLPKH